MSFKIGKSTTSKINKTKFIKTAMMVVAVLGIVGLASAVNSKWSETSKQKAVEAQAVAAAQADKEAKASKAIADLDAWRAAYQNERVNCEKGLAIYNGLTAVQKKVFDTKKSVPTCGPAVLPFERD